MKRKKDDQAAVVEAYDQTFVIFGEPASKANSRKMVHIGGRPAFIKSEKALSYLGSFMQQVKAQIKVPPAQGFVRVELVIHYASRRPDLDESVILDALQGYAYLNDRQVRQRHAYWALDKDCPRAVVRVVSCDIHDIPPHLMTEATAIDGRAAE